ncbi:MAG: hypothetical protein CM15mP21_2570 [Hyphomicrobiales bacterium]|nr:MAG: hypothetical protein CM15mP21_2570 [Hyphomicrobiales bacterium]
MGGDLRFEHTPHPVEFDMLQRLKAYSTFAKKAVLEKTAFSVESQKVAKL